MSASLLARERVRTGHRRMTTVDGLLAGAFVPVAVFDKLSGSRVNAGPWWVNAVVMSVVILLLALRRVSPEWALVGSCAVIALPTVFVRHDFFVFSHAGPLLIELYTVGRYCSRRRAFLLLSAPAAAVWLCLAEEVGWSWFFGFWAAPLIGMITAGQTARRLAQERTGLADAMERLDVERAERERLVVLQERARLAFEMHDVVATAVSLMTVQARAARSAVGVDTEASRQALVALEAAGRGATADLRRMLGLLRVSGEPDSETDVPLPALAAMERILPPLRAAGLRIHMDVTGDQTLLPAAFDVAACRILQEALTNTLKHAGPTDVNVRLHFGASIEIDVADRGRVLGQDAPSAWAKPESAGYGLLGMRERVELLGGEMLAGPDDGGFAVQVRLPVPAGI